MIRVMKSELRVRQPKENFMVCKQPTKQEPVNKTPGPAKAPQQQPPAPGKAPVKAPGKMR